MIDYTKPHIYRRQIIITGKYYIGKHKGGNKCYLGSGIDWLKDLKLYVKNPKVDLIEEILEYVDDISKLNEREEWWLQSVDAANNPLYYNKTNRHRGWTMVNDEQKEKLRISHLGKKQNIESTKKKREKMLGKPKHTIESKKQIGNKNKKPKPEYFKEKLRKPKTEQHKQNISKSKQNILRPEIGKPVLQYDLQGNFIKDYLSASDAARSLNKSRMRCVDILCVCKGKQKTAFGYKWKFKI